MGRLSGPLSWVAGPHSRTTPRLIFDGFLSAMNFSVTPCGARRLIMPIANNCADVDQFSTKMGSRGASGTWENLEVAVENEAPHVVVAGASERAAN